MANLTADIGSVQANDRIIQPISGPNVAATLFNSASNLVDDGTRLFKSMGEDSLRKAAAAKQAATADTLNDIATSQLGAINKANGVFTPSAVTPTTDGFQIPTSIQNMSSQLTSQKTAEDQGRATPGSYDTYLETAVNDVARRHPGNVADIMKYLKEQGHDHYLTSNIDAADTERKAIAAAETSVSSDWIKLAGTRGVATGDPHTDANSGRQLAQADEQFRQASNALDLATRNTALTQSQFNFTKTQSEADMGRAIAQEASTTLGSFVTTATGLITSAPDDASGTQALSHVQTVLGPAFDAKEQELLAKARAGGMSEPAIAALKESMDTTYRKPALDLFTGEHTKAAQNVRTLTQIQTKLGIDAATALPILTAITKNFGPQIAGNFFGSLSPEVVKALTHEVQGFSTADVATGQRIRANIQGILSGDLGFHQLNQTDANAAMVTVFPTVVKTGTALAANPKVPTTDGDFKGYAHGAAQLYNAALAMSPTSMDVNAGVRATSFVASATGRTLLDRMIANPDTKEQGLALVNLSRGGSARIIKGLEAQGSGDSPYYKTSYNPTKGIFEAVYDKAKYDAASSNDRSRSGISANYGGTAGLNVSPVALLPQPQKDKIAALNANLEHLVATQKYDTTIPKTATPLQVRSFFANSTPISGMGGNGKTGPTASEQWFQKAAEFDKQVTGIALAGPQAPKDSGGGSARGERNKNPGNIVDGNYAKGQPGYTGSDGKFAQFDTHEHGVAAQTNLLTGSYIDKGYDTPFKIISKYAPPKSKGGDNSEESFQNYVHHVATRLGIGPNDKVPSDKVAELGAAMRAFENGHG